MARKPNDPNRSAAQLRRMMRNWRMRAWWGVGFAGVSVVAIAACWHYQARGLWWFLSIMGVVSALISVFADINAYHDTKKRAAETEKNAG